MVFAGIIGVLLAVYGPKIFYGLAFANYSRASLDGIMLKLLGKYRIDQVLTDELLIVAYDYNSQEPRFFSKYLAKQNPNIYNTTVGNATGASSAAPTFFDPKTQYNPYDLTEYQIDGGIICNNPVMFAYQMAKDLNMVKEEIRIISLGTGEEPLVEINPKDVSIKDLVEQNAEFMMKIDTHAANAYVRGLLKLQSNSTTKDYTKNFVRGQVDCRGTWDKTTVALADKLGMNQAHKEGQPYDFCAMDSIEPSNIEGLKFLGELSW